MQVVLLGVADRAVHLQRRPGCPVGGVRAGDLRGGDVPGRSRRTGRPGKRRGGAQRPGDLASSNQKDPIMKLMAVDPLNVELVLPVAQYGRIKLGQHAQVAPEEPVGGSYKATVEVVDPTVDAASGTFGVRLKLPNPGTRIPAGVKCRVRF